ncbi:dehydrogenase/reductase SDR family member on chromosome X homolog [Phodopus roborovskii]|uniref:dehydrogenase/reductase SDR family member on chromosome X homolog n=1 Tax=Phodopus roborovskii TaxID=109678 RepID=UPI0021E50FC3|nr:dehydrogenase/reductase SDR family member on chromosome X homolog [Phodopus roborovskii]
MGEVRGRAEQGVGPTGIQDPDTHAHHDAPLRPPHSASSAYAGSKLALVLFSRRLQWLLVARGDPVTSSVADSGVVDTALYRHAGWGIRAAKRLLGWALFKVRSTGWGALGREHREQSEEP